MKEKRYAIVRVDNSCPAMLDDFGCIIARNMLHCKCGEDTKNYGDTKEQLIKKVAQVIKRKLKGGLILRNTKINETYNIQKTISAKVVAKEIVEFLGVEE